MTLELRPFQQEGVEFLSSRPRALLADEMGLGKTPQLLSAARGRTLVVAPAMILDAGVWDNERDRWRPDLDMTTVSYSSLVKRVDRKWTSHPKPEYAGAWDTVIADEAHYLKGRKTHWTRAFQKVARKSERVYLATGTPIPNWAHELFTLLQILHPDRTANGQELASYWRWVRRWFGVWKSPWGSMEIGDGLEACREARCDDRWACVHWQEFHDHNLGGVFLQRLRDNVLTDLPPLSEQTLPVKMHPKQRKAYNELKDDFIAWVDSGEVSVAWNRASLTVKLAKVCTGLEVEFEGVKGSGKLNALRELLENRSRPTLVVTHFRATARHAADIATRLNLTNRTITGSTSKTQRHAAVEDFQNGKVDVLVGTIETIGEGLTLTAADMVVFVERSWRPSKNDQALRRIHRIGQDRPVSAVYLVSEDSIDQRIVEVLASKTDQQMKALRPHDIAALL